MYTRPFPSQRVGSGDKTTVLALVTRTIKNNYQYSHLALNRKQTRIACGLSKNKNESWRKRTRNREQSIQDFAVKMSSSSRAPTLWLWTPHGVAVKLNPGCERILNPACLEGNKIIKVAIRMFGLLE